MSTSEKKVNELTTVQVVESYETVKEAADQFNGTVAIFKDNMVKGDACYWVEQQRKDVYTDYLTLAEAEAKYNEFLADTMF